MTQPSHLRPWFKIISRQPQPSFKRCSYLQLTSLNNLLLLCSVFKQDTSQFPGYVDTVWAVTNVPDQTPRALDLKQIQTTCKLHFPCFFFSAVSDSLKNLICIFILFIYGDWKLRYACSLVWTVTQERIKVFCKTGWNVCGALSKMFFIQIPTYIFIKCLKQ